MKVLKLYIWTGVLSDYTSGVAFALAYNITQARKLVLAHYKKQTGYVNESLAHDLMKIKPIVKITPTAYTLSGGA